MYKHYTTADFTYEDLDKLQAVDIEEYKEYLKLYQKEEHYGEVDITNGERGMKRKMSALRSLFTYLYRYELIQNNPVVLVDMPKLHDKAIIRLEPDETARLLDFIEHGGDDLTGQKRSIMKRPKSGIWPSSPYFWVPGSVYPSVWGWMSPILTSIPMGSVSSEKAVQK